MMKRIDSDTIVAYLRQIKPELQKEGIESIALFGSFASGDAGVYSDIDIAIQKSPRYLQEHGPYDYFATLDGLRQKLRRRFHRNVDIVDLDSRSPFLDEISQGMIRV